MNKSVRSDRFLKDIIPFLRTCDTDGLIGVLHERHPWRQLVSYLACEEVEVVEAAVSCLGIIGDQQCVDALVRCLGHRDPTVVRLAEQSLWQIWFRSGTPQANRRLAEAVRQIEADEFGRAESMLTELIDEQPDFAEPYNQRAIVAFLTGRYEESVADCQAALRRNPHHFGAAAGMGHAHASLGNLPEALESYQIALTIHPRLDSIAETARHVEAALKLGVGGAWAIVHG